MYLKNIIKTWVDYHDLYVQLDTVLLADVFENFRNMWAKIDGLDSSYFYLALD